VSEERVVPRQSLNMSNVGRKDREAARALLGFTAMAMEVRPDVMLDEIQCVQECVVPCRSHARQHP
jgi:hypothetical protein